MWFAPAIRLSKNDSEMLLCATLVFAFFAGCFGLAAHNAIVADYVPIAGGKFGWTSVILGATLVCALLVGAMSSLAAIGCAMEYDETNGMPVIFAVFGIVALCYAAIGIVGFPAPSQDVDFLRGGTGIIAIFLGYAGVSTVAKEVLSVYESPFR